MSNHNEEKDDLLSTDELKEILDRNIDFVRTSDTKASIILSVYGVILALLLSYDNLIHFKKIFEKASWCYIVLVIIAFCIVILGIYYLFRVINAKVDGAVYPQSRIFFGGIVSYKTCNSYENSFQSYSRDEFRKDLFSQIYINAEIADLKFYRYKAGLFISLLGFSFLIILWLVGIFFFEVL